MMTFNEKNHWVFHLVPTACSYAKLDEYFGKLRNAEIGAAQMQRDLGENSAVGNVVQTKIKKWAIEMGKSKAIIPDMKDTRRNSLLRVANTISGCS